MRVMIFAPAGILGLRVLDPGELIRRKKARG